MRISVKVKVNARESRIEKISGNEFALWVDAPAQEGKANARVVELLSGYFKLPKSRIEIVKGLRGKKKLVDIYEG